MLRNRSCCLPDINRGESLGAGGRGGGRRGRGRQVQEGDGGKEPGHIDLSPQGTDWNMEPNTLQAPPGTQHLPRDLGNNGSSTFLNPEATASSFTGLAFDREISRVLREEE